MTTGLDRPPPDAAALADILPSPGRYAVKVTAAFVMLILTGCVTTIPADRPSSMVALPYSEFQFLVAPPPSETDVSTCVERSKYPAWSTHWFWGPWGTYRSMAEGIGGVQRASAFTDCLTQRGYVVERIDEAPPSR